MIVEARDGTVEFSLDAVQSVRVIRQGGRVTLKNRGVTLEDRGVTLKNRAVTLEDRGVTLKNRGVAVQGGRVAANDGADIGDFPPHILESARDYGGQLVERHPAGHRILRLGPAVETVKRGTYVLM